LRFEADFYYKVFLKKAKFINEYKRYSKVYNKMPTTQARDEHTKSVKAPLIKQPTTQNY
jgi:hypothetical protein